VPLLSEMWSLMNNQLQEKSKTEDKVQAGVSDSSTDSQRKEFEFSDDPNKPVRSDEDFSDSDRDR